MNFLQRTPFFRLLLPLCAGIIVFQFFGQKDILLVVLLIISMGLFVAHFFLKGKEALFKNRWIFGIGVFLFCFCVGYFISGIREKNSQFSNLDQNGIYLVELSKPPVEKAKSYKCEVDLCSRFDNNSWLDAHGKALIYIKKDSLSSTLLYGDKILLRATFRKPPGVVNPDGFDYEQYLRRKGIRATAFLSSDSWEKVTMPEKFSLYRTADVSRKKLLEIYKKFGISGDEYAVLAALTLGFTDDLQPDLLKGYSATGAMHILSVSGLHVGIVYVVIVFLLGLVWKRDKSKVWKMIVVVVFLWVYAFITGLSPSVIRSALMFSLVAVGSALSKKSQIYNTVFMSAFIMLLINPDYLFDVGFELSYMAVLSIVLFQKPFSNLFPVQNRLLRWLRDLVSVSIAAQLGTLPVTLYYFQQFPNYFLLTNIIAIPLSTIVIYLAILLLVVNLVPVVSTVVAFLLKWSVWMLNFSIAGIQHLPSSVSTVSFDFHQLFFAFMALAGITAYFFTRKYWLLLAGLTSLLLVLTVSLLLRWETLHSRQLIVYSSAKSMQLNLIDKGRNYVWTTDADGINAIATGFWRRHFISPPEYIEKGKDLFSFGGKTILIAGEEWWKNISQNGKLEVDYLVLGNRQKPKMKYLLENVNPHTVIVDNSVSEWYTESIRKACTDHHIPFYSIADRGAFILKFTD